MTESKKLNITSGDYSLGDLKNKIEKGKLIPNPEYQRQYVYNDVQASKLIESVLMNIPIPTVYLCEENDGKWSIIDGQQRIVSFTRFLSNEFALKDLSVFPNLNGNYFKNLSDSLQSKIEDYTLRTIIINQDSSDMKFDIFARLNQGAVKLNQQELRNCIYRGPLNNLLKELAKNNNVAKLYCGNNTRMVYEELILRFFALRDYPNYRGSMMKMMNKYMQLHQNDDEKEISKLKNLFIKTIDGIVQILGEDAFCAVDRNTRKITNKFSGAVYDSIIIPFSMFDKNKLFQHADAIRAEINRIKTTDNVYLNDFTYAATGSRDRVIGRITMIYNAISNIVGNSALIEDKRNFEYELKKELFEECNRCVICGNEILSIDDAELDHIVSFSRGGRTNRDNVQLTHRYCNRHKSNTDEYERSLDGHIVTFWEMLEENLIKDNRFDIKKNIQKPVYDYVIKTNGEIPIIITLMTKDNQIRISAYLYKNIDLYNELKANEKQIEENFGEELSWNITDKDVCRISCFVNDFEIFNPSNYINIINSVIYSVNRLNDSLNKVLV